MGAVEDRLRVVRDEIQVLGREQSVKAPLGMLHLRTTKR